MQQIAVFGAAFNPPTLGHLDVIEQLNQAQFDKILLIPSYRHAFGKEMAPYDLRLRMLEQFLLDIPLENLEILAIEDLIAKQDQPVYTYDLLCYLQENRFIHDKLHFIIGPDNQKNWAKFHKAKEIQARWTLVTVQENKHIRSTKVREAIRLNQDIGEFVSPRLARFLHEENIYSNKGQ